MSLIIVDYSSGDDEHANDLPLTFRLHCAMCVGSSPQVLKVQQVASAAPHTQVQKHRCYAALPELPAVPVITVINMWKTYKPRRPTQAGKAPF